MRYHEVNSTQRTAFMKANYTFDEHIEQLEYDDFATQGSGKAHFLRSYAWGQVSKSRGWVPYYVGVRQDGRLVATALLLKKALLMGYSYFYIPRGFTMDYSNEALLEFMTASLKAFSKKHRAIHFKIDPDVKLHTIDLEGNVVEGAENNYALVEKLKALGYRHRPLNYYFEYEQPRFTFRIPLEGTIEEIEDRYNRMAKRRIKQTQIPGMKVVVGNRDNVADFFRLMSMTEKRKNFYSHPVEYYQKFYDIFAEQNMVTLYLGIADIPEMKAKLEEDHAALQAQIDELIAIGTNRALRKKKDLDVRMAALQEQMAQVADKPMEQLILSAYLVVHYGDRSWALYAGNDMHYSRLYANYMVYCRQIRDAVAAGKTMFDQFGSVGKPNDDSSLVGLYDFKKLWGGEFTEFIGEFDHVENPLMFALYTKLIPYYHKHMKKSLRKRAQRYAE